MCVLPAVLLGAVLVPLVASALSWLFPRGVARLAEPDPGWRVDAVTLALGAAATAVVLCAAVVAMAATAGRTRRHQGTGHNRLAGWVLVRPAASLGTSFARDPSGTGRRSRSVAVATVAGIAVSVGGVVAVAALDASRQHLIATPRLFGSPAELLFESNGTFGIAELVDGALAAPGVSAVTRHVSINDDSVEATGPDGPFEVEPEAYVTERGSALPAVVDGAYPQGTDEVALGPATAADLGADRDDTVTVPPLGGGAPIELRVSGRVVSWSNEDSRRAFIVQPETLREIICPDLAGDECDESTNVFASVDGEAGREALIALGFRDVKPPATVDRLRKVGPIPWYLAGFLCLLGAAGLAHGLMTALRRRRRDLAIARALGLTARGAAAALTWQAGLTAVLGAAAGVVGGAIVGPWLWQIIADDLGVIVEARLPVLTVVIAAAGTMVIAAALSLLPRWRAAHLSAAEGLRAE
ncbi:MAG: FtsX-like permease family protein [Ilumatobacteraceae bacterium]